ncbi:hypothetical protein JTB14_019195 [Gonioctena quinquepunctata]|nr:hypothetical protein JTB14_019195 [Gonioctena quinquepunctata]
MWSSETLIRRSSFTAAMSRNRFGGISVFLRFDDKSTRAERKHQDKLAAIGDLWDMFIDNCRKAFEPHGGFGGTISRKWARGYYRQLDHKCCLGTILTYKKYDSSWYCSEK